MTSAFEYNSYIEYDDAVPYDSYVPSLSPIANVSLWHLSSAMTVGTDGSFLANIQDTLADVSQCVEVVVGTPIGQRTVVPKFGVADPTFQTIDKGDILRAINTWEPRASASVTVTPTNTGTSTINIAVSLEANPVSV